MAIQQPAKSTGSVILMEHARRMQAAREQARQKELGNMASRAFAAAQLNRLTDSWRATQERIDDELRNDLDALRARSRSLENNNDFANKYLDMVETNIIGETAPRLVPLADNAPGSPDELARNAISASWAEWSEVGNCETSGQFDFAALCQMIARGTARDGEYLIAEHLGAAAGNQWGYALQIIDVDRLATWMNRVASEGVNAIITGVEVDSRGKPVGYWINETNRPGNRTASRIDAGTVIHRFIAKRPEQKRGIPWMHASMLSMHYAGEFALSAIMAAKHGADHLGFFVSKDGVPPPIGDDADDEAGAKIMTSAPGTYDTLPDGYDIKTVDSKYPNEVFAPFIKSAHQRMASGLPGASYPELCNDYEAVNFSSIRAAVLSARDEWRKRQKWFAAAWLRPIYLNWLRFALAKGAVTMPNGSALPASKYAKFKAHAWQFRGWAWVDPLKDIEASKAALDLKLTSRSRLAAEMGRDLEEVFDELQREEALASKYQIELSPATPTPTAPQEPPR